MQVGPFQNANNNADYLFIFGALKSINLTPSDSIRHSMFVHDEQRSCDSGDNNNRYCRVPGRGNHLPDCPNYCCSQGTRGHERKSCFSYVIRLLIVFSVLRPEKMS